MHADLRWLSERRLLTACAVQTACSARGSVDFALQSRDRQESVVTQAAKVLQGPFDWIRSLPPALTGK